MATSSKCKRYMHNEMHFKESLSSSKFSSKLGHRSSIIFLMVVHGPKEVDHKFRVLGHMTRSICQSKCISLVTWPINKSGLANGKKAPAVHLLLMAK